MNDQSGITEAAKVNKSFNRYHCYHKENKN